MFKKLAYTIAVFWTLLIAVSCLLPPSAFQKFRLESLFEFDKLLHLTVFLGFSVFWLLSLLPKKITLKHRMVVFIISVAYGIAIELIQASKSIGRSFEWGDVIADTFGAFLGVILIQYVIKILPFVKKRLPFLH